MGRQLVDACDNPGCSATRGETNHWFVVMVHAGGHIPGRFVSCKPLDPNDSLVCPGGGNLGAVLKKETTLFLACGEKCATEIFSRLIGELGKGPRRDHTAGSPLIVDQG